MWRRVNRLESVRPMVRIDEVCWEQFGDEVWGKATDPFLRSVETGLRQTLYQWRHMPADMVVDDCLWCPVAVSDSGYGLLEQSVTPRDVAKGARDFQPLIRSEADAEKILPPTVRADWEETGRRFERMQEVFGGILPVRRRGITSTWFAPWDRLTTFYGIEELYQDMIDRPRVVHAAISRMTDAMLRLYEQYERMGLLALNNGNVRVGSGGPGFTDELPQADFDRRRVRMIDMWGNSTAQIFSEVSPAMHEEFALRYELRILERFGLNCYGCCEPLHKKIGILRRIPRLRKISMSPFVNIAEGAAGIGQDFVYSAKPNPAVLAGQAWSEAVARKNLRDILDGTRGLHVEIILKDIHTVRDEPRRLHEWSRVAMEMAEEYAA